MKLFSWFERKKSCKHRRKKILELTKKLVPELPVPKRCKIRADYQKIRTEIEDHKKCNKSDECEQFEIDCKAFRNRYRMCYLEFNDNGFDALKLTLETHINILKTDKSLEDVEGRYKAFKTVLEKCRLKIDEYSSNEREILLQLHKKSEKYLTTWYEKQLPRSSASNFNRYRSKSKSEDETQNRCDNIKMENSLKTLKMDDQIEKTSKTPDQNWHGTQTRDNQNSSFEDGYSYSLEYGEHSSKKYFQQQQRDYHANYSKGNNYHASYRNNNNFQSSNIDERNSSMNNKILVEVETARRNSVGFKHSNLTTEKNIDMSEPMDCQDFGIQNLEPSKHTNVKMNENIQKQYGQDENSLTEQKCKNKFENNSELSEVVTGEKSSNEYYNVASKAEYDKNHKVRAAKQNYEIIPSKCTLPVSHMQKPVQTHQTRGRGTATNYQPKSQCMYSTRKTQSEHLQESLQNQRAFNYGNKTVEPIPNIQKPQEYDTKQFTNEQFPKSKYNPQFDQKSKNSSQYYNTEPYPKPQPSYVIQIDETPSEPFEDNIEHSKPKSMERISTIQSNEYSMKRSQTPFTESRRYNTQSEQNARHPFQYNREQHDELQEKPNEPPQGHMEHFYHESFTEPEQAIQKEEPKEPLEILDVHQHFKNDLDLNTIDDLPIKEGIIKIHTYAETFEEKVNSFEEEKYSLDYFILDEKLMRLIEKLDKLKTQDDLEATHLQIEAIRYIKSLHTTLDQRAKDEE